MGRAATVFGSAGVVDPVGTATGPCADCAHAYCMTERALAETPCLTCHAPIGYGRRFTTDAFGDRRHEQCVAPRHTPRLRHALRPIREREPVVALESDPFDLVDDARGEITIPHEED